MTLHAIYLAGLLLFSGPFSVFAATNNVSTNFEYLVSFGDSYTDNGLSKYITGHQVPGVYHPTNVPTYSGGKNWGDAVQAAVPNLTYFDYAISGGRCSADVIANMTNKMLLQDALPIFLSDWEVSHQKAGMYAGATSTNTLFALWIGTNDLHSTTGYFNGMESDTIYLYSLVECYWRWVDELYKIGGRRFVVFTPPPLHLSPLETMQNKAFNTKVREYVTSVRKMAQYGAAYETMRKRWPGAQVTTFDAYQILSDIYYNGSKYLSTPANVKTQYVACKNCKYSLDHFMWYVGLHPSNKTHSIVAKEFLAAVTPGYAGSYAEMFSTPL